MEIQRGHERTDAETDSFDDHGHGAGEDTADGPRALRRTPARPFCRWPSCWRPGALVEFDHDDRDPVVLCTAHRKEYFGTSS